MSLSSRLVGWYFDLPPAETRDVVVRRDIEVPMPDGAVLLADHYAPRGAENRPTILLRSPYGRARQWGIWFGRPFAERGFQVLLQSCRGTFGSGGTFEPFATEREDGVATVAWIKQQPWFSGKLATFGPSYLGVVQWAMAPDCGPDIGAMAAQLTTSSVRDPIYQGESFWLHTALFWMVLVDDQELPLLTAVLRQLGAERRLASTFSHLPLQTADLAAVKKEVPYYRDWLAHAAPGDPWWDSRVYSNRVGEVSAPVLQLGAWYDLFLPQTLADYRRLRAAGKQPHLTVGPWHHLDGKWQGPAMRESIAWFRAHLLGDRSGLRDSPVRLFVMGADEWRDFPDWPPPGYSPRRYHLQPEKGLSTSAPPSSPPDAYRYDPADPTPTAGGTALSANAGPKDNRAIEARADVLVYTTEPLDRDVEVIGDVSAELFVKSSLEHTDFFARLCDVAPSGKSINVCDGLQRVAPGRFPAAADGVRKVTVELWSTAHVFKKGHRIRLQVASGAHPRFARNPGSGEPLATGTTLVPADQTVYHDPAHPSAILLPVRG